MDLIPSKDRQLQQCAVRPAAYRRRGNPPPITTRRLSLIFTPMLHDRGQHDRFRPSPSPQHAEATALTATIYFPQA
jgi:hypothetical protein